MSSINSDGNGMKKFIEFVKTCKSENTSFDYFHLLDYISNKNNNDNKAIISIFEESN